MEKTSLGLVETQGLVAAVEAADAGAKAAYVTFLGYELTRAGLITVKFLGDVAAVQAAVSSAVAAADRVGRVISTHVIPRPDKQLKKVTMTSPDHVPPVKRLERAESGAGPEKDSPAEEAGTEKELAAAETEPGSPAKEPDQSESREGLAAEEQPESEPAVSATREEPGENGPGDGAGGDEPGEESEDGDPGEESSEDEPSEEPADVKKKARKRKSKTGPAKK